MEPAAYPDGQGGIRLNDNVAVRVDGNEVLSRSLPRDLDGLVVTGGASIRSFEKRPGL